MRTQHLDYNHEDLSIRREMRIREIVDVVLSKGRCDVLLRQKLDTIPDMASSVANHTVDIKTFTIDYKLDTISGYMKLWGEVDFFVRFDILY